MDWGDRVRVQRSMLVRVVAALALIAACSGSGSLPAEPTLSCSDCALNRPLATHSVLYLATSWYGACWTGAEGGVLPTPGEDEGPNYREFDCNAVAHRPAITCPGGYCAIRELPDGERPPGWPARKMNERYFAVEVRSEGSYAVVAHFDRSSGDSPTETRPVAVYRPDAFAAECGAWSPSPTGAGSRDLRIRLRYGTDDLAGGPPALTLRQADVACAQAPRLPGAVDYSFTCPAAARAGELALTLEGQDFRVAQRVACP